MDARSRPSTPDSISGMSSPELLEPLSRSPSPPPPSSPRSPPRMPQTPRHWKHYYFDDKMIVFMIDNIRFRVHRHFLARESEECFLTFLCDQQAHPAERGGDAFPFYIPGVSRQEMETLLDFFYEGMCPTGNRSLQFWVDLLSISSRLRLKLVRQCAIDHINASQSVLDPVEKILLSKTHDIPEWFPGALEEICLRSSPLSITEGEKLGVATTILIAQAREAVRPQGPISRDFTRVVDELLNPPQLDSPQLDPPPLDPSQLNPPQQEFLPTVDLLPSSLDTTQPGEVVPDIIEASGEKENPLAVTEAIPSGLRKCMKHKGVAGKNGRCPRCKSVGVRRAPADPF